MLLTNKFVLTSLESQIFKKNTSFKAPKDMWKSNMKRDFDMAKWKIHKRGKKTKRSI